MHIFSKIQKHILLLKKIKELIETTTFAEFQKKYMQGDSHFMKYITYLENLSHYLKFELAKDEAMHSFASESQDSEWKNMIN